MQRPMSVCRPIRVDIAGAARIASNRCATEGSEEDLNRRQQRKQRGLCLGFCDGHPVGVPGDSPVLQSSSRFNWRSQMQRPMSVCRSIRVDIAVPPEPLRTMLNRRQRRGFEQKAAKETKGLGFRDGHPAGTAATPVLQSSSP